MANIEAGSAYVTMYPRMGGDWTGQLTKATAIGNIFGTMTSKAFDAISASMGSAIKRLDTMSNFPKVMKNLGYSTNESKRAIAALRDGIQGLPTGLDSVVTTTQQLAPLTGSLGKATKLTLALNNAMLGTGKGSAEASRAMVQYTQMLSKGKVDMQSWHIMMEVMAPQLDQLGSKMLGAGKKAGDLYQALQDGTVSFDDFNNAILELNEKGIDGLGSFAEQARAATDGVGTALENVPNKIAKAIQKVMEYIGQANISGVINKFSDCFDKVADAAIVMVDAIKKAWDKLKPAVMPVVQSLQKLFEDFSNSVKNVSKEQIDSLSDLIVKLAGAASALVVFTNVQSGLQSVASLATSFAPLVQSLGVYMSLLSDVKRVSDLFCLAQMGIGDIIAALGGPLTVGIAAFAALAAGLVYLWTTSETFRNVVTGAFDAVVSAFNAVISCPIFEYLKVPFNNLVTAASDLIAKLQPVVDFIGSVFAAAFEALPSIFERVTPVLEFFAYLIGGLLMGALITFSGVIQAVFSTAGAVIEAAIGAITTVLGVFIGVFTGDWSMACDGVSQIVSAFGDFIMGVFEAIGSFLGINVEDTRAALTGAWETAVSMVSGLINGFNSFITGVFNDISSFISGAVNGIKSTFSSVFTAAFNIVSNIFNSIKTTIGDTINGAKDLVFKAIEKIKSFFNFKWELPKLKLPHFSVSGKFSLMPPSIPKFSVNWYAKGGVFDAPSVVGVGEAGQEAVLPIDKIKPYFHEAARTMEPPKQDAQDRIIKWLDENLGRTIYESAPVATPREFKRMVANV